MFYVSAGVDNNETLKVFRSGGADPDGNQPGDLYVTIKVGFFGNDIYYHFILNFVECIQTVLI